ncbi:unnamed protein product [Rotaria sordida]|uniref:Uncharacterized protein n=1 Tax=Rotaria sordida TaxID=392033 RepID=A0A819VK47_9BILA|nr:unnamed protein product [Rotaria sordida]
MNNKNPKNDYNSDNDDYSILLKTFLEDVNNNEKQNLAIDFDEDEDLTKIIEQFISEAADCNNSGSNDIFDNIEQPTDSSVNNEQYSAMVSNNSVAMITLDVHKPIYLMNPILNIFRIRSKNEFIRKQVRGLPKLKDCIGNSRLNFMPVSEFTNAQVECTIVFQNPNGEFYFPPYEFVRGTYPDLKFENPTIYDLEKDTIIHNQYFSLEIVICKLKNSTLESNDKQQNQVYQIQRVRCGTKVTVDHELLSSWGINDKKKKTKQAVLTKLPELLNLYTAYIIIRRTHWHNDEKRFVPEQDILFCSNPFTPKDAGHPEDQYDYSPNQLRITKLEITQVSSNQKVTEYNTELSFIIPEMYKCTGLKNKYVKIEIVTGSEQKPEIHSNYKIMNGQRPINSKLIPVDEYISTVMFNITRRTVEDWETDFVLYETLPVSSSNSSTLRTTTMDNSSMNSFRIQLQLCDCSNDEFIPYRRSSVLSALVIDDFTSSKEDSISSLLKNDNLIDDNVDQLLTHEKRSLEKETYERTGSPLPKSQKS